MRKNIRVDEKWYLSAYPDVAAAGVSPQEHYDNHGRIEGRYPRRPSFVFRMFMRTRVITHTFVNAARRNGGYIPLTKKVIEILKKSGLNGLKLKVLNAHERDITYRSRISYDEWLINNDNYDIAAEKSNAALLSQATNAPLFSIVMATYNTPSNYLKAAIDSITRQAYPRWELCITDDCSPNEQIRTLLKEYSEKDSRIKIHLHSKNQHISAATNSAIKLASGDFIVFMDHDDELHPLALSKFADKIIADSDLNLLYSDEDKIDNNGRRFDPHFKCDFNYELLLSQNTFCHLVAIKRDLANKLGGLRSEYNGAQDHDFILRAVEVLSNQNIAHIPHILYHWRVHDASTAASTDAKPYAIEAGRRAVTDHLKRLKVKAEVLPHPSVEFWHKINFSLTNEPSVDILIPTRDRIDLMRMCINSILSLTTYPNYKITIIDNGSIESETLTQFTSWSKNNNIRVIRDDSPFNYSALNNNAAFTSEADYVVLLNNDIEIITPNWIEEMLSHSTRKGVGCVGACLWYPDDRLQHGGVILGVGGVAGHAHKFLRRGEPGYLGRAVLTQRLSAVTAACLMIKRSIYLEVGGLDEKFKVAFNDIDFCLRVKKAGYNNIWTPFAEMYHHESASRGAEDNPEKIKRFNDEVERMISRWDDELITDPYYSPNLTLIHEDFSYAEKARVTIN